MKRYHVIVSRNLSVAILEESLVVIIFHCTLKNMKKLTGSSLYPRQSTVRSHSFLSLSSGGALLTYPHDKISYWFSKNQEIELCWLIVLIDDSIQNIKFAHIFDTMKRNYQTFASANVEGILACCDFKNLTKTQMFCRYIIPLGTLSTDSQLMTLYLLNYSCISLVYLLKPE